MQQLGKTMGHHRLVLRMGQVVGSDIVAEHRQGRLSQEDWAEMVRRCQGCEWACRCKDWLQNREFAQDAPETCPNREKFAVLRAQQGRDCQ
ncbi:DUF6455 family protein [Ruegeria arenilitoris]|uniref:DUF6455 family protein n=1 Tax=Ruegeria arenilitoris TaxID=1173585 RepID=UPI00147A0085|nr:DUF6455 family protein [Ruegeria arenilitoris]